MKAIAKNPSDRFANASELAAELERFFEGRPIRSRRLSMAEQAWRWSRRNPALAVLTVVAAALTAVLLVGSAAAAWNFREQRDVVRLAQRDTQESLTGRFGRASAPLRTGPVALTSGTGRPIFGVRPDAGSRRSRPWLPLRDRPGGTARLCEYAAELRDEVIAAAGHDRRPAGADLGGAEGIAISSGSFERGRPIHRAERRGVNQALSALPIDVRSGFWEPTGLRPGHGRRIVPAAGFSSSWSGRARTELWDLTRGEIPAMWPADARSASPRVDGRQVAVLRADGFVHVYDLPALTEAAQLPCRLRQEDSIRRLLDVAVGRWPLPGIHARRADDGPRLRTGDRADRSRSQGPDPPRAPTLALSRTGGLLAIIHDRAISVYDVASGDELALLQGHQSEGITAQFQPAGGCSHRRAGTVRPGCGTRYAGICWSRCGALQQLERRRVKPGDQSSTRS